MVSHSQYKIAIEGFSEDASMEFRSMDLTESMGGDLPQGILHILTSSKSNPSQYVGKTLEMMIQTKAYKGTHKIFISNVQQGSTTSIFSFIITDPVFTNEIQSRLLSDNMDLAIKRLYPGKIIKKVESSVNSTELRQTRETDYNCLKRLMIGYGKDILYGFSMDGLMITNTTCDVSEYPNYKPHLLNLGANTISESSIKYNDMEGPRLSKKAFRYFRIVAHDKRITYTIKNASSFEENATANTKNRVEAQLYVTRSYNDIPPYKLCEKINLADPEANPTNNTHFFVTARGISFNASGVSTTLKLSYYG